MITKHTQMVVAAAKELCKRSAEVCGVDYEDNWKIYGNEYLEDAQAMLDACAAPDLLEALQLAHATLCGANMNEKIVAKKVMAAIAKANGEPA